MFPKCYMLLCPCVYGLQQYGHLNNSSHCASCFVIQNKKEVQIDVIAVFNKSS